MRMIGTLAIEANARRFSAFLTHKGIENRCEASLQNGGPIAYQLWVSDEDRLEEAHALLKQYEANPSDAAFDVPLQELLREETVVEEPQPIPAARRLSSPVTSFFLSLCLFVFFLSFMEKYSIQREGLPAESFVPTPIEMLLLYDLPPSVEQIATFVETHPIPANQKIEDMSPALKSELDSLNKTPFWRGLYEIVLYKVKTGDASAAEGPLFIKIRQGQIWRLFSPCVLHSDLLHILFNMIWLWVLGRPIEQRVGPLRTVFFTLAAGIVPNTAQYLMSGPLFLGYSGIVTAFAGFIWMREKIAPWEGYPIPRSTLYFLAIFVLAMVSLQAISFFVQIFSNLPFVLSIANTAHIVGALLGLLFGRLSSFAWRVKA